MGYQNYYPNYSGYQFTNQGWPQTRGPAPYVQPAPVQNVPMQPVTVHQAEPVQMESEQEKSLFGDIDFSCFQDGKIQEEPPQVPPKQTQHTFCVNGAAASCGQPMGPVPSELVHSIGALQNNVVGLENQVKQLKINKRAERAREQYTADEAYSLLEPTQNGFISRDRNGIPHQILQANLTLAMVCWPDEKYRSEKIYALFFAGKEKPLLILERDFKNPEILLQKLEGFLSTPIIRMKGNGRKTGKLFQSCLITAAGEEHPLPFYAGWQQIEERWEYTTLLGSTHGHSPLNPSILVTPKSFELQRPTARTPAEQAAAAERVTQLLGCITSRQVRTVIFSTMMVSFQYSLFRVHGQELPMGLCVYSTNAPVLRCLEDVLLWHGDAKINFQTSAQEFKKMLSERKDQPLVLNGNLQSKAASQNYDRLVSAIVNVAEDSEERLQAFPVILGSTLDRAAYDPHMITLEIHAEDMRPDSASIIRETRQYLQEYLENYSSFLTAHPGILRETIEGEEMNLNPYEFDGVDESGLSMISVFGISQKLARAYHKSLGAPEEVYKKLELLFPEEEENPLLPLLERSATYADSDETICAMFSTAFYSMIEEGKLQIRNTETGEYIRETPVSTEPLDVYTDPAGESFYLVSSVFSRICQLIGESTHVVARAVHNCGLISGARVNNTSYLTRKTISDGTAKKVRLVFKISQEILEEYASF